MIYLLISSVEGVIKTKECATYTEAHDAMVNAVREQFVARFGEKEWENRLDRKYFGQFEISDFEAYSNIKNGWSDSGWKIIELAPHLRNYHPDVVLVEMDYKGCYERYALSFESFCREFGERLAEDMPIPLDRAESYTLRPLVHVWYQITEVESNLWNSFFGDMEWELPESDIESGNLAYVREEYMPEGYIREQVMKTYRERNGFTDE